MLRNERQKRDKSATQTSKSHFKKQMKIKSMKARCKQKHKGKGLLSLGFKTLRPIALRYECLFVYKCKITHCTRSLYNAVSCICVVHVSALSQSKNEGGTVNTGNYTIVKQAGYACFVNLSAFYH